MSETNVIKSEQLLMRLIKLRRVIEEEHRLNLEALGKKA